MTTVMKKAVGGILKHFLMTGAGSEDDPYIPQQDVNIQDQHSPMVLIPFHKSITATTLALASVKNDLEIEVTSATSFAAGLILGMYNGADQVWYQGRIIGVSGTTITLDTPLNHGFHLGDKVSVGSTAMNVNGATTSQIFTIRAPDVDLLSITGDITQILMIMQTTTQPGYDEFGDLTALTNGLVLRKTEESQNINVFNCKSNAEIAQIMFDFDSIDQAKFSVYGIKARLRLGGQENIGVVIRLAPGEDLEVIVQDNLTSLVSLEMMAVGHLVV